MRGPMVAISASLGGLAALEEILAGLPASFPAPVTIVQHRRPEPDDSGLGRLLGGHSRLPVCEPDDKEPIRPGHIYLAPPNYHLLVDNGSLSLSIDPPVLFSRPSADVLFESVAASYGKLAIGVVLTGASEDGAAGAAAIKRGGGIVLVQDPATAVSPVSPRATLARIRADAVLPLSAIADRIVHHCLEMVLSQARRPRALQRQGEPP